MKTQAIFLIAAIAVCFGSCKKNNEEIKDIRTLFSNTTWTGEAKYTTRPITEPFSVRFDAAGNFIWNEFNGKYPGTFTIDENNKTVTIHFNGGTTVTGTVSDNNKLINLKYGAAYPWVINSMELSNTPESDLTGTVWTGNYMGDSPGNLTISFQSSSKMLYNKTHPVLSSTSSYKFENSAITFTLPVSYPFFGVINKGEITGIQISYGGGYHKWKVTRL